MCCPTKSPFHLLMKPAKKKRLFLDEKPNSYSKPTLINSVKGLCWPLFIPFNQAGKKSYRISDERTFSGQTPLKNWNEESLHNNYLPLPLVWVHLPKRAQCFQVLSLTNVDTMTVTTYFSGSLLKCFNRQANKSQAKGGILLTELDCVYSFYTKIFVNYTRDFKTLR